MKQMNDYTIFNQQHIQMSYSDKPAQAAAPQKQHAGGGQSGGNKLSIRLKFPNLASVGITKVMYETIC